MHVLRCVQTVTMLTDVTYDLRTLVLVHTTTMTEVICLSDSDEETTDANDKESTRNPLKSDCALSQDTDDDVEVVDGGAHQHVFDSIEGNGDEDLMIMGSTNTMVLPHNRQDCLLCRYRPDASSDEDKREHRLFCRLCYCYVCDKPAIECIDWFEGEKGECVDAADHESKQVTDSNSAEKVVSLHNGDNTTNDLHGNDKDKTEINHDVKRVHSKTATVVAIGTTSRFDLDTTPPATVSTTTSSANKSHHKNHCQATDTGPLKTFWCNMRAAIKEGRDPYNIATQAQTEIEASLIQRYADNYGDTLHTAMQHATSSMHKGSKDRQRRRRSKPSTRNHGRRTRPRESGLDPRQRIRAQTMLEALYRNPDSW